MILGKVNTRQTSQSQNVPAPVGGLNGRDPRAAMAATDAYLMDNAFPGTAFVYSRKGCDKHTNDVLAGPVQTLDVYTGGAGEKMLAWAGGKIYDVSNPVASELATGQLSNTPINAMFSNAGAQFLISVTGTDVPKSYNGAAIANLAMTGMTGSATTLNFVFAFKERLYFGQRDRLGFYYLPVGQIQGALSYFDLAQVARKGGHLIAIASYSDGSGETPQDYIVFVTSQGECIVYAGFDPSAAANWGLVGRYYMAKPIGARCALQYGSELVFLTMEGALAFSDIRRVGDAKAAGVVDAKYEAITSKLGSFLTSLNANADVAGWQGLQYTGEDGWLLINAPATSAISGAYYHYVMNTVNRSWCRYTDWNGLCFTVFNKRLYFGRFDGHVMLADEGRLDDGEPIRWDVKQAYSYFEDGSGLGSLQKHFQWASLLLTCDGTPPLSGKYSVDFKEEQPEYVNEIPDGAGAEWDTATWDLGEWGQDEITQRFIITLNRGGFAGALWLRASLQGLSLKWYATQYVMQKTRGLLI